MSLSPTFLLHYFELHTNKARSLYRNNMASKQFTPADVASHKTAEDGLYIIIDKDVFDVTNFVDEHPGGSKILKRVAGKDATKQFWKVL